MTKMTLWLTFSDETHIEQSLPIDMYMRVCVCIYAFVCVQLWNDDGLCVKSMVSCDIHFL